MSWDGNANVWAAQACRGSTVAALTILIWDILITFDDELEYLWMVPHLKATKVFFVFLRYFALALNVVRVYMDHYLSTLTPTSILTCKIWFVFQMVSAEVFMATAELLLMFRVYALYNRRRGLAIILSALMTAELGTMSILLWFTLPRLNFGNSCTITMTIDEIAYFCATFIFSQSIVWVFTIYKCHIVPKVGRGPIAKLLVRDGSLTFLGLFIVLIMDPILAASLSHSLSMVVNPWAVSIMSIAGCRIIINLRRLATHAAECELDKIEFTTVLPQARISSDFTVSF